MRKIKSRSASGPPRFFVCVPCPARRAQGVIIEGIKPSGKTQTFPPHIQRRRAFPASLSVAGLTCIFPFSPLLSMTSPLCPPGGGKGPVMGALPPFEAPFQTPESPPVPRAEALCSLPACSNKSFAFGTLGLVGTGSHGGATKLNASFSPFPPYRPAGGGWGFSGRARRPPTIPPTTGRGTHEGGYP